MKPFEINHSNIHKHPVLVAFPHSGAYFPSNAKAQRNHQTLLSGCDWYLPELFCFLKQDQVTTITANLNPYAVDLNADAQNVVPCFNQQGQPVYNQPPDQRSAEKIFTNYSLPYREAIAGLLHAKLKYFSKVWMLDIHSFYSAGIWEDVLISDCAHQTAEFLSTDLIQHCLVAEGLRCARNIAPANALLPHLKQDFGSNAQLLELNLNYRFYIENREFIQEEAPAYRMDYFHGARQRLQRVFQKLFYQITYESTNQPKRR